MNHLVQYLIVGCILLLVIALAVRALIRMLKADKSQPTACIGCPIADHCNKTEKKSAKKCDRNVAQSRK